MGICGVYCLFLARWVSFSIIQSLTNHSQSAKDRGPFFSPISKNPGHRMSVLILPNVLSKLKKRAHTEISICRTRAEFEPTTSVNVLPLSNRRSLNLPHISYSLKMTTLAFGETIRSWHWKIILASVLTLAWKCCSKLSYETGHGWRHHDGLVLGIARSSPLGQHCSQIVPNLICLA